MLVIFASVEYLSSKIQILSIGTPLNIIVNGYLKLNVIIQLQIENT